MSKFQATLGACAAVAVSASSVPASASSFPCFYEQELQSARIHDLSVMLMVGALNCRDMDPYALRAYGDFVEARTDLNVHGDNLLNRMIAEYGEREGRASFRAYETRLSNYHSNVRQTPRSCDRLVTYSRMAETADHEELATLSKLATNRALDICRGSFAGEVAMARPLNARAEDWADDEVDVTVHRDRIPPQLAEVEREATELSAEDYPMLDELPVERPRRIAEAERAVELAAEAETEADANAARLDAAIAALDQAAQALRDLRQTNPAAAE